MNAVALPARKELRYAPAMLRLWVQWNALPEWKPKRWYVDRLRDQSHANSSRRSPITRRGYRAGLKPANFGNRYPATPPTPAEMLRILEACGGGKTGVRNRALLTTLWRSGLRISEALDLRPFHVSFDHCTITVESGKGSKYRVVGTDQGCLEAVQDWLVSRSRLLLDQERAPLFCTVSLPVPGGRLHSAYVRELCRDLARKAVVPHRVAPHQLRHAHAVELARERTPMHLIQRQLGHGNLGTTATYLSSIAPQEVIDYISRREWPSGGSRNG